MSINTCELIEKWTRVYSDNVTFFSFRMFYVCRINIFMFQISVLFISCV